MSKVGENDATFQQSKPRRFRLTFKENRSFELTVKGTTFFFKPNGSQAVDEYVILNMTEFEKLYFNVEAIDAD